MGALLNFDLVFLKACAFLNLLFFIIEYILKYLLIYLIFETLL